MSAHFKDHEFACHCCGVGKPHPELIEQLENLRAALGNRPITITSGHRCKKWNRKVGGVKYSQHYGGCRREKGITRAADISIKGVPMKRIRIAAELYFKGRGWYRSFTHCDVRKGRKARWRG